MSSVTPAHGWPDVQGRVPAGFSVNQRIVPIVAQARDDARQWWYPDARAAVMSGLVV
jgi:hypothetical protein